MITTAVQPVPAAQADGLLPALEAHVREHGQPDSRAVSQLAERLHVPPASIRAALSFYDDLRRSPDAVRVCHGTSCALAGADALHDALAGQLECTSVHCLGYCDRSPAVLKPDRRVLVHCDAGEAKELARSLQSPRRHPKIEAPPMPVVTCIASQPVVTQRLLRGDHGGFGRAWDANVYQGLVEALSLEPGEVIDLIERSDERGRGGAAFSTAAKWRSCAQASTARGERYVIANGDEGDPGSFIDRVLMEFDPHAVLEGMIIAAYAVGAARGIVFIRSEYPRAIERMRAAVHAARAARMLGDDVLGTGFAFDVAIVTGLGSYVCGEESAMLNAIEGRRGEVRLRPPYPAECGLYGKPTVVNNVETLVNIGWIARHGADAYRAMGTEACPGTKAMCLNHGFARPGVVEVEFGVSLREVIESHACGGGGRVGEPIEAVLLGGPMGSLLTPDQWDVPVCYDAMSRRGVLLGHGGLVAMTRGTDWRAVLLHLLRFMQHESCGKCVPCRTGSLRALEIAEARGPRHDAEAQLRRLLDIMADGSLCAFGQLMPGPIRTILDRFGDRVFAKGGDP